MAGNDMDDQQLNAELQRRVKELFGSSRRESVNGAADRKEGEYSFEPQNSRDPLRAPSRGSRQDALFTLTSIAVMSVIAGILFTFLFESGYIHDASQDRPYYNMPTYGTTSYIEPVELLTKEFGAMEKGE